ncbi:SEA domain family protein [Acanthocheilonema viteae]
MRSEILIHLLVSLLLVIAQNVESENNTMEAISSSPSSQTVQQIIDSEAETTPLAFEPIQKLAETIAPRERGFPLPEIKEARELATSNFEISTQQPSSTTSLPFITEIDHNTTTEAQFDHFNYQNATQNERRNNDETNETSISDSTKISKSTPSTINGTDIITKLSEYIENEDELPPEVRAEDPFGTTITGQSTISTSSISQQQNIIHMNQNNSNSKMNLLTASSFLNNTSDSASNEATMKVNQSIAFDRDFNTDTVPMNKTFNATSSSLKSEPKMIIRKITNGTTTALEIQTISQEIEVTVPKKQRIPVLHTMTSETFNADNTEQTITSTEIATVGITAADMSRESGKSPVTESVPVEMVSLTVSSESFMHSSSSEPSSDDAFVTESLATVSPEIKHQWETPTIPTISTELPQTTITITTTTTTNEFSTDMNQHEEDDETEHSSHEDESLFVGDKTLFIQDDIIKSDFSGTQSIAEFITPTETMEENFGVPGFSRIERLGPEATEETQLTEINAVTHNSSLNIESQMRTDIPIDLTKNSNEFNEHRNGEHTSGEKSQTAKNSFEEDGEVKDISVIDESFYHTEEAASTFRPIISGEGKLESEPTSQPELISKPILFPESEVSSGNFESEIDFKVKSDPEFTTIPEDFKGSKNDLNNMLHIDHAQITNSHDAKEGSYKTPFSFRITSIDYIPEFGDSNSGKYKKLRDQLMPDLEEIFGSIFGHIYNGVHLVSFLKGSVIVEGMVYTSVKPDNLEQLATEFEQQITAKNSQLGGNDVDPRSILLNGFVSKNYVERIHEGYTSGSTSSYIVGGAIAIGILTILLIAFTVIATNNRRTNGKLKLKEENIAMADNNRLMWQNGTSPVNLMGYGNGHMMEGGNGQPSMVMVTTIAVNDGNSR